MKILVQLFWNNICSPAVGYCWSVLFFFIDYLYSFQWHASLLTFDSSLEGWLMFLMYDEMHTYAFLPKLRSTCQISFQVIHDV